MACQLAMKVMEWPQDRAEELKAFVKMQRNLPDIAIKAIFAHKMASFSNLGRKRNSIQGADWNGILRRPGETLFFYQFT